MPLEKLVANIRQEAVNQDVIELKTTVSELKISAITVRGGFKTLVALGTAISMKLVGLYHIMTIFLLPSQGSIPWTSRSPKDP